MVGVAAELEVDAGLFGLLQAGRLVVQQEGESPGRPCQFGQGFAAAVGPVIPADDVQSPEPGHGIPQKRDPGISVEALGSP